MKKAKVSAAGIMDSDSEAEADDDSDAGGAALNKAELEAYLELPQMKFKTDWGVNDWWRENKDKFPNLEVMARQYLGCPSTSASVERLFSAVGIAFSAKRKRSKSDTLESIMFARSNLP